MTVKDFLLLNEQSIGSAGAKWDSCDALKQLNKARSALYGLDNWDGLLRYICVPAVCNISLPWFAEDIKGAFRCNSSIPIHSGEYWVDTESCYCGTREQIRDTGEYAPVPISNSFSCKLGFTALDSNDKGKVLTITYNTIGGSQVTEEIILANEAISVTENRVAKVISISKESTHGIVQVNLMSLTELMLDKAFNIYPMETSLSYRQYCLTTDACNQCSQIILKVKTKFVPFTDLHYNLNIDFIEHALSLAMEAVAERGKRTIEGYKMYQELIRSSINYLKKNTQEKDEHTHDFSEMRDYPSIV